MTQKVRSVRYPQRDVGVAIGHGLTGKSQSMRHLLLRGGSGSGEWEWEGGRACAHECESTTTHEFEFTK